MPLAGSQGTLYASVETFFGAFNSYGLPVERPFGFVSRLPSRFSEIASSIVSPFRTLAQRTRGYLQYDTVSSAASVTSACIRTRHLKQPRGDGTAAKCSAGLKRAQGKPDFALLIPRTFHSSKTPKRAGI